MFDLLNKLKKHIKIEYILGLLTSILVPLFIMLLYWNKSISNYDGWYNLYAQDILSGRIPYVDFHFLMPPLFLYVWTLLQKIFNHSNPAITLRYIGIEQDYIYDSYKNFIL